MDDCTTYGLSFGVAAAFLHKAGAATITGVALGKFGSQLKYYEIVINSDPFAPIPKSGYSVTLKRAFTGATSNVAQDALRALIP